MTVVAPDNQDAVWINQDSWFSLANFDADKTADYTLKNSANGVYVFVIGGDATINGVELNERDGLGITETDQLNIVANTHTEILLIEVPMNVNVE